MVLQGRRGVVTTLDIVSPTTSSGLPVKNLNLMTMTRRPRAARLRGMQPSGASSLGAIAQGEHRSVAVGVEAPPLTMIGRIV